MKHIAQKNERDGPLPPFATQRGRSSGRCRAPFWDVASPPRRVEQAEPVDLSRYTNPESG